MKILCFQPDIVWENRAETLDRLSEMIGREEIPADSLLVFPELCPVGFSMNVDDIAEPDDGGESARFFSKVAKKYASFAIAGIPGRENSTGPGLNQAFCFGPDGSEIGRYQKIHLFSFATETEHYTPGKNPIVFEAAASWKIAPTICYDLRFPELYRTATLVLGAEILVNIANWPTKRVDHWITLLQARAIENQAYVVGVNRCGNDPHITYPGASMIVNPHGEIIARAGDQPEVISATPDRSSFDEWRRKFPALLDAGT